MYQQENHGSLGFKFKRFLKECYRVLKITKKPNKQEYMTIVKVTSLGMAAIGLIGFILTMIKQLLA